jgi:hypothetical protein
MLGTAYLDRKGDYEDWEFAQEFKDLYEKYRRQSESRRCSSSLL